MYYAAGGVLAGPGGLAPRPRHLGVRPLHRGRVLHQPGLRVSRIFCLDILDILDNIDIQA